jgi:ParB-like chromosome segregation protein Spo0J
VTPRTIPESTIAALGELLVRMVGDEPARNVEGAARAGADVRRALRALCTDALEHDVRVEQLVIAIKQGWSSLHSDHPRARSEGPDTLLNQVITLCIDEYYA